MLARVLLYPAVELVDFGLDLLVHLWVSALGLRTVRESQSVRRRSGMLERKRHPHTNTQKEPCSTQVSAAS